MPSRDRAPSFLLLPELAPAGAAIALPEDERHYLIHVCRARPGDRATATDGRGMVATVRLLEGSRPARVEVESVEERPRSGSGWVLCGAPEGGRADWMVEKLAELGVTCLQPVDCARARWPGSSRRLERLRRVAGAALRQSRRAHLLEVRAVLPLDRAVDGVPEGAARWLASQAGAAPSGTRDPGAAAGLSVAVIGPAEGLDAEEENSLAARGFRPIVLSDARLRTETAAVAWAAWWSLRTGRGLSPRLGSAGPASLDGSEGRP